VAFVFSATVHEASHALAAKLGGDPTAYEGGQVTIDPIPHIRREPMGMVAVPLISLAVFGWPLGFASAPFSATWAAQHPRRAGWMSLAGPGANLGLVLLCCLAIWIGVFIGAFQAPESANFSHVVASAGGGLGAAAAFILSVFFTLNLILFLFNLFPLPPLDGSGALPLVLPAHVALRAREIFARPMFSFLGLLIAWNLFGPIFDPVFTFSLNVLYPGAGYH